MISSLSIVIWAISSILATSSWAMTSSPTTSVMKWNILQMGDKQADYVPDVILVKKKEEKHPKKMKFTKINKHVKEEKGLLFIFSLYSLGSAKRAIEKYEQDRDMLYEYDMENDFENLPEHFNVEEVTEAPDLDFDSSMFCTSL